MVIEVIFALQAANQQTTNISQLLATRVNTNR